MPLKQSVKMRVAWMRFQLSTVNNSKVNYTTAYCWTAMDYIEGFTAFRLSPELKM